MAIPLHRSSVLKGLLVAGVVAIAVVLTTLPARADSSAPHPITIAVRTTANGDEAAPFNFAVQPGRVIEVRIRNYTRELHTFAIPAIGLNVAVPAATSAAPRTVRIHFVVPRYGVYTWFCVTCRNGLHPHHRMGGKLYAWISPDLTLG